MRHTAKKGGNAPQFESSEGVVFASEFAFALQNVDVDHFLVIDGGGEDFRGFAWNGGIARNERHEDAAHCFDAKR